jgi:putative glutamine amidotransferase
MLPLIGITTSGRHENPFATGHYDAHYALPAPYIDAVRRAGGIPVLLPPGEPGDVAGWVARCDGFVVSGGADIDPARYGGDERHPQVLHVEPERDAAEIALVQALVAARRPALCICRGLQVLNVALGGTLIEHIGDVAATDHHRNAQGGWTVHRVHVAAATPLAAAMRATVVDTFSGHHQAIRTPGAGLDVIAHAPDGIIEAAVLAGHPWMLGVQWHPEKTAAEDPTQQRLFDVLVARAQA